MNSWWAALDFSIQQPVTWIWTVIAISLIAWYVSDILASIVAGIALSVPLNTILLLLAALPVLANRKNIVEGWRFLSEQREE